MAGVKKPLSEREKFCLCGFLATGDYKLAYLLSREKPPKFSNDKHLMQSASRWMHDERVTEFVEAKQRATQKAVKEDKARATKRTRKDTEEELNILIDATDDPKIKGDLLLKLSDFNKWKQQEETPEDKRSVFYIPLRVDECIQMFAYKLKQRFGWSDEEAQEAEEIMRRGNDPKTSK